MGVAVGGVVGGPQVGPGLRDAYHEGRGNRRRSGRDRRFPIANRFSVTDRAAAVMAWGRG